MTTLTSDTPARKYEISIPITLHSSLTIMSLEMVEQTLNSDPLVQRRLREAIELSLNLTLSEVKPGKNYERTDAFEIGPVNITERKG
jgi:hypothetical protein